MKNVSLGKQLQFVNLKMLVLTPLSLSSTSRPPLPRCLCGGGGAGPGGWRRGCSLLRRLARLAPRFLPEAPLERPALVPSERRACPPSHDRAGCTDASRSRRLFLLVTDVSKFLRESEDGVWRGRFRELLQNEWRGGGGLPGSPAPLPRTGLPWPRLTARTSPSGSHRKMGRTLKQVVWPGELGVL